MIYVETLQTNMKLGNQVKLGPKTLLLGPNGAGKSTILQSLELVTKGVASDLEGRDLVKQARALSRLFPPNVEPSILLTLSNGAGGSWSMVRKDDGTCKEPVRTMEARTRWPIQEMEALLSGDASKIVTWLESRIAGDSALDRVLALMDEDTAKEVHNLVALLETEDLNVLADEAKKEGTKIKKEANKVKETVENMMKGIPTPKDPTEVSKMQARLTELKGMKSAGLTENEYERMGESLRAKAAQYHEMKRELEELHEVNPAVLQGLSKAMAADGIIHTHHSQLGKEMCWVCGTRATPDQFDRQAASVQSALSILGQEKAALEKRNALVNKMGHLFTEINTLADRYSKAVVRPDTEGEIAELTKALIEESTVVRSWENATKQQKMAANMTARADRLSSASKELKKVGKKLVGQKKKEYEAKVNSFLPEGETCTFSVDTGRVGLLRDGKEITALSGAEWTRVLLALASVESDDSLCILAPKDRAWDSHTLANVMRSLADAPCQVILMSTVPPDETPEGWTVVRVGEG